MKLKDKVCLITGGARGIGRSIAESFLEEGAQVIIFDLDQKQGQITQKELNQKFGSKRVHYFHVDISNEEDVELNLEKITGIFHNIDILVNNAGITRDNLMMRMPLKDWKQVLDINLTGAFLLCKNVVRNMIKNRKGKIINISSIVGLHGNLGQANYAAAKAGLIGLTKSLAKELAAKNIQVNAVAPGYIDTAMTENLKDEVKQKILDLVPAKRLGSVEDVAKAIVFLASSDSDYITGTVLNVDGGMGI
ncbi:MAG: 3-oxoacyl-[acyl-carrier-protein] reductase [Actinomycetota bacterium]|nr:3-oxoacyl-[acyl-carrier-protein] reductase [Actinomycetota bacterium]